MTATISNEKSINKRERLSGIEAYRILAILLICISHAVQTGMNYVSVSNSRTVTILLNLLSYSGQCGNIMFIICSSYFLVDSKRIKLGKTLKILFDSMTISIIVLLGMLVAGYSFTSWTILMQILPDYFSNMWFIPIYVLFYLIHPLLNLIINNSQQKTHFITCLSIFFIYGLIGLLTGWHLGINELIAFIIIYFFVAYIKKYCDNFSKDTKTNLFLFITFLIIFLILAILKTTISLNKLTLNQLYSPILFPMLLFLFNIFKNSKIKSNCINYLASCSLFVYCFHENILLRNFVRPKFYEYVLKLNPKLYFCWVILCGVGMFILGYLVSLLYKLTFSKITNYLSEKTSSIILKAIDFVYVNYQEKDRTNFKDNDEKLELTSLVKNTDTKLTSLNDENSTSHTDEKK